MITIILSTLLLVQANLDPIIQNNRLLIPCDNTTEATIQCLPVTIMGPQRMMMSMDNTGITVQAVVL